MSKYPHHPGCRCHAVLRDFATEMLHYQQGSTESVKRRYIHENAARGSLGKIAISLPWKLAQRIIDAAEHPESCPSADKYIIDDRDLPEILHGKSDHS